METDQILNGADDQDESRSGPAALMERVEKACPGPLWQWPDELPNGQFIEWALQKLEWSQQQFADYLGVSGKTVSLWISGHQTTKPWLKRMLKQLILLRLNLEIFVEHQERSG